MEPSLNAQRTHEISDPAMRPILTWIDSYTSWEKLSERVRSDLTRRAHLGDTAAIEAVCNHNLRLVLSRAIKKTGCGVPLPDLVQEGWIGLRLAARKFDPRRGTQFSSVAVWWIDHALREAIIRQGRMVYLPHNASERLARIAMRMLNGDELRADDQVWMDRLARQLSGNPNLHGVTIDYFDHLTQGPVSLDKPVYTRAHGGAEQVHTLADILPAPSQHDPSDSLDIEALLLEMVNRGFLTRREGWLVVRHFGLDGEGGRTYLEMAREMATAATKAGNPTQAVRRQRIEQLISAAMRKVRQYVATNRGGSFDWQSSEVYLREQRKRPASAPITGQSDSTASPKTKSVRRTPINDSSKETAASRSAAPTPLRAKSSTKTAKGSSRHTKGSGLDVQYPEAI